MIETIKNDEGDVLAYIEFHVLNAGGQFQDFGQFLYVNSLYITPKLRGSNYIKRLIKLIDDNPLTIRCDWVYWNRSKFKDRVSKLFSRKKAKERGNSNGICNTVWRRNGKIKEFTTACT